MNHIVQQLLAGEKRQTGEADMILEAAGWAASSYANFDARAWMRLHAPPPKRATPSPVCSAKRR